MTNENLTDLAKAMDDHLSTLKELVAVRGQVNNFMEALAKLEPPKNHPLVDLGWSECYYKVYAIVKKEL
jgi:hypothetical protein